MNNKIFEKIGSLKRDPKKAEEIKNWLEDKKMGIKLASAGLAAAALISGATACTEQKVNEPKTQEPTSTETTITQTPSRPEEITPELVIEEFEKLGKEFQEKYHNEPTENNLQEISSYSINMLEDCSIFYPWFSKEGTINGYRLSVITDDQMMTYLAIDKDTFESLMQSFCVEKSIFSESDLDKVLPEERDYYSNMIGSEFYPEWILSSDTIQNCTQDQLNSLMLLSTSIREINLNQNFDYTKNSDNEMELS
ncbi:MAG: hypothetical protein IJW59_01150 [Clostridia bacterium]|nr:hypothetical protein [Clostridia bacterium]